MKILTRKTAFSFLKGYCKFSDDDDYVEVTEWSNEKGYDISVGQNDLRILPVTKGQFELIKKLVKKLNK